jgi:large subunit ribosomal protein L10
MVQQYKVDKVNQVKEYFNNNKYYVFNDYSGLNVEKITELRDQLRELNSKFVVIKNNYITKIVKEKEMPDLGESLIGPTAVTFTNDDVSEVLKILFKYSKGSTLKVKGGWVDGRVFNKEDLDALSKLPGRDQLIAMLMSTLNAPIQNFVFACNDVIGRFVRALNAVGESKK